ncbi:MAG: hypothetical protein SF162_14975 [bacterium]|nr:hypothetical protein [bacterium]
MIAFVIILLSIGLNLGALSLQRRFRRVRWIARRIGVVYWLIVVGLALGEGYFRFIDLSTDGRLASDRWMARFWRENAFGYRDREWQPADWQGKSTVALLGDSVAAGWGIENPADRFGDVLAAHLGAGYALFNITQPGAHTLQSLANLRAHPASPVDVVILQYFLDDIHYALLRLGLPVPTAEIPLLARESFLANFLYSRNQVGFGADYWQTYYAAYDNFAVWDVHRGELQDLIAYVESIDAALIVVIFPNMADPVASIPYVDRVAHVFEEGGHGDRVIKLFDAVAAWQTNTGESPILSEREAHPTTTFHHWLGNLLYEQFFRS